MKDEDQGKVVEGLMRKMEEFGASLDDEERAAFVSLIGQGRAAGQVKGVSSKEFRQALDFLVANRIGKIDVARRKDDDGFWAQWAQRQY